MKNTMKKIIISIAMILAGVTGAFADTISPVNFKVGVVDVNAVVTNSAQVQALKIEQAQKLTELQKWLDIVKADVEKQQTKEGKEKLIKKYNADFAQKQEKIKKDYNEKLKEIDLSISKTIAEQAKSQNYDIIFTKGVVLFGGDDITKEVIKVVK